MPDTDASAYGARKGVGIPPLLSGEASLRVENIVERIAIGTVDTRHRNRSVLTRMLVGMGVAVALVLGTASSASAATVSNWPADDGFDQTFSNCGGEDIGQSFTATATGAVTEITIFRFADNAVDATLHLYTADGPIGSPASSQPVTLPALWSEPFTIHLAEPFDVHSGEAYTFVLADAPTCGNQDHFYGLNGYAGGTVYADAMAYDGLDLAFSVTIEEIADADGDGVTDGADLCPGTVFTPAPKKMLPLHVWSTSAAGYVDRTGQVRFTMEDTHGCAAQQLLTTKHAFLLGIVTAYVSKFGVPSSAVKLWIARN
jgi:hypothetical protein